MSAKHLSASSLAMLARCPLQYHHRYDRNLKRPPGVVAVIGKGTHKGIEKDLNNKIMTGELLPLEQIETITAEATRDEFTFDRVAFTVDEKILGKDRVQGEAVDSAVALARLHHHELAPTLNPTHVERYFRLELQGYEHDLTGYIDIQEGSTCIRDTKTRSKAPAEIEVERSLQLTIYAMALRFIDGREPDFVRIDALVKNKKPKLVTLEATRDKEDFNRVLRLVEIAERMIAAGIYYPSQDPQVCSKRWCGYWYLCEFGAKQSVTVAVPAEHVVEE